jgi:photosynthetic reaction center H subunit
VYDWQFFGTFDLARISLWLFWLFFAGLVYWIQKENQREGYPLENDNGTPAGSLFATPEPKTFLLPHGGTYQAPDGVREQRELALARTNAGSGFPFAPTGDGLRDGVGPAAWAMRKDEPELDAHGHAKIQRMSAVGFSVAAGRDPRGLPVASPDLKSPGKITDLWVDVPEQLVRYLEVTLADGGTRLIPMPLARIKSDRVIVQSIPSSRYAHVPQTAVADRVTKLEEDKISAFFAGGPLFTGDEMPSRMSALMKLV